ncbi:MAG: CPBP family glutamic-type intramembrane protease, partial [Trebonia sp.]
IVGVLVRCSYHIYYGVGVIGIAVWATAFVLLYLRFRSVIPLIILHFLWDATLFLGEKWIAVTGIGNLLAVALLLTGVILWLVDVSSRRSRKRPLGYPPYPYQSQPPYPYHPGPAQYPGAPLYPGAPQYPAQPPYPPPDYPPSSDRPPVPDGPA